MARLVGQHLLIEKTLVAQCVETYLQGGKLIRGGLVEEKERQSQWSAKHVGHEKLVSFIHRFKNKYSIHVVSLQKSQYLILHNVYIIYLVVLS